MITASDVPKLQNAMAAFLDSWMGRLFLDTQTAFLHGYSRQQLGTFLNEALRFGKPYYCLPSACRYLGAGTTNVADWNLSQEGVPAAGFCCLAEPLALPGTPPPGGKGASVDLAALFWSYDDGKTDLESSITRAPGLFVGVLPTVDAPATLGPPLFAFAWPLGTRCSAATLAHDFWGPADPAGVYDYALGIIASFFAGLASGALGQRLSADSSDDQAPAELRSIFLI